MARWLAKHYFWVLSVRVFLEKISIRFSRQSKMWVSHSIWWGPKWNKNAKEGWIPSLSFLELGHLSSPVLGQWSSWFLGLWDSGTYTHGPQVVRPSDLGWYSARFLCSSAHRWQIVGLLGFFNHVSQSYDLLLYISISYWFCFSTQPRQIQHSTKPINHYLLKNTQQYGRDLLFIRYLYAS